MKKKSSGKISLNYAKKREGKSIPVRDRGGP
jgi:hypothetical protein